ncbi:MAG: 23S rRNA (pseudouridine(1915)-N(3))-methyltransferase RlmH [Pseudomonadota bacterium]|nr:23S rRNA (pseudouridine(1915)-N(3))-methyltransferase RlmH [Pseudomonadota bacterium]
MRLLIGAVGRMKSGPESQLLDRYCDRIRKTGRTLGIGTLAQREIAESRAARPQARRDEEATGLLAALAPGGMVVSLDETGRDEGSLDFARRIETGLGDGTPEIAFLIGGPDGHGAEIAGRAHHLLRFGRATWPHQFVRVMLAEQLYRAVTILSGHPYHRA